MKILSIALSGALALGALSVSAPASAAPRHHRGHPVRVCHMEWHHHHKVRACHTEWRR